MTQRNKSKFSLRHCAAAPLRLIFNLAVIIHAKEIKPDVLCYKNDECISVHIPLI